MEHSEHPQGVEGVRNMDCAEWMKQVLMWMMKPEEGDRCDVGDLMGYVQTHRTVLPRLPRSRSVKKELIRLSLGQEAETSHVKMMCVACMAVYVRSQDLTGVGNETIVLGCAEGTHILCDIDCAIRYIERSGCELDLSHGICPFCTCLFSPELVAIRGKQVKERYLLLGKRGGGMEREEVRCEYCGMTGKWGVELHEGGGHWMCSETCLRCYVLVECPQSGSDVACPSPNCSQFISTQLLLRSFGDLKSLKHALKDRRPTLRNPSLPSTLSGPKLRCCNCRIVLHLNSILHQSDSEKPLFLACEQPGHVFCSKDCLRSYVEVQSRNFELDLMEVRCPICRGSIEKDIIVQAYNGQEALEIRKRSFNQSPACLKCARPKGKIQLACGHRYCHRCVRKWYKMSLSAKDAQIKCPACHRPVNDQAFQKVMSKMEKVGEFFSSFWSG